MYFDCIYHIFKTDLHCEVTLEIIRLISQNLAAVNYDVNERYLRILENVQLSTHADEAEAIRIQAKICNKKRKRKEMDVKSPILNPESESKSSQKKKA